MASCSLVLPFLLVCGLEVAILLAWTWGLARERRLRWWYAFYGLLVFTGTVYVMTLPARDDPEGLWRARTARALRKPASRVLLAFLTVYMTVPLVMGGLALVTLPFVGTSWVHYHVDGREVETVADVLPRISFVLYVVFLGVFHYAVTRRRVRELVRTK